MLISEALGPACFFRGGGWSTNGGLERRIAAWLSGGWSEPSGWLGRYQFIKKAMNTLKVLTNFMQILSIFKGICNIYRNFLENFAKNLGTFWNIHLAGLGPDPSKLANVKNQWNPWSFAHFKGNFAIVLKSLNKLTNFSRKSRQKLLTPIIRKFLISLGNKCPAIIEWAALFGGTFYSTFILICCYIFSYQVLLWFDLQYYNPTYTKINQSLNIYWYGQYSEWNC